MRILLDEGVPDIIQKRLSTLSIFSVPEMGWRGVKNGILLDLMADDFRIVINDGQEPSVPTEPQKATNLRNYSSEQRSTGSH